jgi:hypothetical protein
MKRKEKEKMGVITVQKGEKRGGRERNPGGGKGGKARHWVGSSSKCPVDVLLIN